MTRALSLSLPRGFTVVIYPFKVYKITPGSASLLGQPSSFPEFPLPNIQLTPQAPSCADWACLRPPQRPAIEFKEDAQSFLVKDRPQAILTSPDCHLPNFIIETCVRTCCSAQSQTSLLLSFRPRHLAPVSPWPKQRVVRLTVGFNTQEHELTNPSCYRKTESLLRYLHW